jgi:hypothetical protein
MGILERKWGFLKENIVFKGKMRLFGGKLRVFEEKSEFWGKNSGL